MPHNQFDKQLIKKTHEELKAAKQRLIKSNMKVPRELTTKINQYGLGTIDIPRTFDSEIRSIIVADMLDQSDYKYNAAIGKFINGRDETAPMHEAVAINGGNDQKRKKLGFALPTFKKIYKPENTITTTKDEKAQFQIKPEPIQLALPFPNNSSTDKQENNFVKKEENFFDGTGIANYDFYILSKTKHGRLEDI
jgi:hypothetical protein